VAIPRVWKIGSNVPGPKIRYHSVCLLRGFHQIYFVGGRNVISTTVTENRWPGSLNILLRQRSVTSEECACNSRQILLISLHVPRSSGKGNINTLNRMAALSVDTARIRVASTLFRNLGFNGNFKYRSASINEILLLCLLQN
jgi:hypothetical protein